MLAKLFRDFMLIWTTVDPIGNLALFAGLTAALTRAERKRVARRATIYAAIILVGAVVVGQIILDAMGVHLLSLKLAGGIILFLFSLQMLFGNMENPSPRPTPAATSPSFPLAVPSIAGPGTIMAVIVLTDNDVYTDPRAGRDRRHPAPRSRHHVRPLPRLRGDPQSHRTPGRLDPRPRHGHPARRPLGRARHERPRDPALGDPAEAVAAEPSPSSASSPRDNR